ncbi:hypothetical protein, partial [Endozoicomonas sp.]|uniref:hypothetical protein n=1 Tax=Endozoicomonas sp. TaxID=1892382 RepID=UPI00383B3046
TPLVLVVVTPLVLVVVTPLVLVVVTPLVLVVVTPLVLVVVTPLVLIVVKTVVLIASRKLHSKSRWQWSPMAPKTLELPIAKKHVCGAIAKRATFLRMMIIMNT